MVVPRAESCFVLLRFARTVSPTTRNRVAYCHPCVFPDGGVTAQAFNGPKLPQGIACRMPFGGGIRKMKGRYSIAEHGWKGEETVDDRKNTRKRKNTHPQQQAKRHLSNKRMSTKHMGKA